jgi:PAS domain S-box-containing protein
LVGWVVNHKQAVLIPDTSRDERWLRRPDDALDRTGPKSAVSAPVLAHDRLAGVLTLVHPQPGFFTAEHLALVEIIAGGAGIAVLNARLYEESRRQARVMTALAESAMTITASLKLEEVLRRILERTQAALRVEAVSLSLVDPDTHEPVIRAATVGGSPVPAGRRLPRDRGITAWVAREGRGVIVPEVHKDSRFDPDADSLPGLQPRAAACAPIRSRGLVTGALQAMNPSEGTFDPDTLLVLTGLGSLAGTAIQNAQLFERLQAAHLRYRELFEDSINPVLITDWHGNILEANRQAEQITGLACLPGSTVGRLEILDHQHLGPNFENLSLGRTLSYEAALCPENGLPIPVQVNARQIDLEDGGRVQWILRDLSAEKNLEHLRADLFSTIYHDLRSPLSNLHSSLEMIQAIAPKSDPNLEPLVEIALRSTSRAQRLASSLLDIQRLEAGQPVGVRGRVPVETLVAESVEAVRYSAENREIDLQFSLEPGLPPVCIDGEMIGRVLINLLENAIKYSPQGSKITGTVQRAQDWVQVGVQDSGPGIPAADLERVFDKFTRLRPVGSSKGNGIGLAFCRLAVEGHGGRIWVESEPGAGSHFKFLLPVNEGER